MAKVKLVSRSSTFFSFSLADLIKYFLLSLVFVFIAYFVVYLYDGSEVFYRFGIIVAAIACFILGIILKLDRSIIVIIAAAVIAWSIQVADFIFLDYGLVLAGSFMALAWISQINDFKTASVIISLIVLIIKLIGVL